MLTQVNVVHNGPTGLSYVPTLTVHASLTDSLKCDELKVHETSLTIVYVLNKVSCVLGDTACVCQMTNEQHNISTKSTQ